MDRPGDDAPTPPAGSPDPEVSLADAGIAAEIARAAARGRGADRAPTLEQLLAAFGERQPTEAARRRVAAALRVAGMGSRPGVLEAEPGQRLMLLPPGSGSGAARGRAAAGLVAVVAILAVAAVAAGMLGTGDGDRASDSLPATATTLASVGGTTATTAPADPAAADTAPATTATDEAATTPTTTTQDDAATAKAAAAERRRKARARARREREARRRHAAAAARRHTVAVVVDASAQPSFLCVDDGAGTQLYNGTLSGRQTFRAKRVRLNIGLASTVVTVNGTRVPLSGSPAGLDISRQSGARVLPLGQRPCG